MDVLDLIPIKVSVEDKAQIKKVFCYNPTKKGYINYKQALSTITIDLSLREPLQGQWLFRN